MIYKLVQNRKNWLKLSWPIGHSIEQPILTVLEGLAELPGVSWVNAPRGCVMEIPRTACARDGAVDDRGRPIVHPFDRLLFESREIEDQFFDLSTKWHHRDFSLDGSGLFRWQREAALKAADSGGLFLADAMGLGKTRSAITAVQLANATSTGPCMIIAPGFTVEVWRSELLAMGAIQDPAELCVLSTRNPDAIKIHNGVQWIFLHYDIAKDHVRRFHVQPPRPASCIVDEVHWVKRPQAARTKAVQTLAGLAKFVLCLTGTPMDNRVAELWVPLSLTTGPKTWGSYGAFRRRYAGADNFGHGLVDQEPTHVEELRARMASFYLRRTVKDIPGNTLPSLTRQRLSIPLSDAAREQHDGILSRYSVEELLQALLHNRAGEETFAVLSELRKLTSKAKIKTTVQHIQSLLDQGESVVCFAWQRSTVERIYRSIQGIDRCYFVNITGAVPQAVRDYQIRMTQAASQSCLVATYGTLREGVTLTRARSIVIHDLDWKPSTILQAEARVHRIGQRFPCVAYWMTCENSIDTIFAKLLMLKAEHIERTLDIDAPAAAMDELDIEPLAKKGSFNPIEWARIELDRWAHS